MLSSKGNTWLWKALPMQKKKKTVLSKKALLNKEPGQSFAFEFSSPKVKALKEAWLFTWLSSPPERV